MKTNKEAYEIWAEAVRRRNEAEQDIIKYAKLHVWEIVARRVWEVKRQEEIIDDNTKQMGMYLEELGNELQESIDRNK